MNTRKELESFVVSTNKFLREVVSQMDLITLLRNCHPMYRSDFAYALLRQNLITTTEAKEFTKLTMR